MIDTENMDFLHRTWVEIDLDRLEGNYRRMQSLVGDGCRILCVVKANAYGHGAVKAAQVLEQAGCDWFGVSNLEEARQLRRGGVTRPILILGGTPCEYAAILAQDDITQALYDAEQAKALSAAAVAAGVTVKAHLKLDTGMHRIGFNAETQREQAAACCRLPGLAVSGVFTHFATADADGDPDGSFTRRQYERFVDAIAALEKEGVRFAVRHCCNSAAAVTRPEYRMDMVREGILLYGLAPSAEVGADGFLPVMSMKARVTMVKSLAPGDGVSYGQIFRASSPMTVATVPVGYADGYWRAYGKGYVLLNGRRAPIVGRICMDQMMVDVTGLDVKVGDTATLFGEDGDETIPVEMLSSMAGTIAYETVCAIGRRVTRVYLRGGRPVSVSGLLDE